MEIYDFLCEMLREAILIHYLIHTSSCLPYLKYC